MADIPITGHCDDKFAAVKDSILFNFDEYEELGMQFCVMQNGHTLIDLCAGWTSRDKTDPVGPKSLFSVYSSGKAIAALVIAWLAEQDRLGYNQSIKTIWPEMDNHGKGDLSVAQFMSHQSGLPGITNPEWSGKDWYDWDKTCAELAIQIPIFTPGSASGYHPLTYGFLTGEIARRMDEHMRSLGNILRDELARPINADVWISLPQSEHSRVVKMLKPQKLANLGEINDATRAAFLQKWSATSGKPLSDWLIAEFAGTNCQATAHGLATLMQIALSGRLGETAILSEDTHRALCQSRIKGPNLVLPFELDFAAGLMRNDPNFVYGPNPETLGHSGWGGSCVFADPKTGLHGSYVMNRQRNSLLGDPRPVKLINTVYDCL